MTAEVRHLGIIAASAAQWNDELTILMSSMQQAIADTPSNHPQRAVLLEMRASIQRCAWLAAELVNYAGRRGARATAASAERLMRDDGMDKWRTV